MFRTGKNKNKKKKQQQQQQPAFRPRQPAVHFFASQGPNNTMVPVPMPLGKTFQAPHHQQESMVELSDDTSPNTPLVSSTGGWKPVESSAETPKQSTPTKKPGQEQVWKDFRQTINTKTINKIGEKSKEVNTKQQQIKTPKPVKQKKQDSPDEIKWELNVVDDTEESPSKNTEAPISNPVEPNPPKPQVIKGTATEIKLIQSKDKPVLSVQKSVSSTTGNQFTTDSDINTHEAANKREPSQPKQQPKKVPRDKERPSFNHGQNNYDALSAYRKGIPRSFLNLEQYAFANVQAQDQASNSSPNWNPLTGSLVDTNADNSMEEQQYSPSDAYDEGSNEQGAEESESVDGNGGQKRLSAFRRLGPVSQPKKPKLTINLLCNKDQSVREVLEDEEEEKYTPVHLRKDIIESSDETVVKYLPYWPWKRNLVVRKACTSRTSKSVMLLEQEQMIEEYDKNNIFIKVSVQGFPRQWSKENVLDVVLDSVKGKSFVPCFIEFTKQECKFLVIRSRSALTSIHKMGFSIPKNDLMLTVTISLIDLTLSNLEFIPRLVLRKLLAMGYDGERKLSLKEFTLKSDISHFIYFPLNRSTNQSELMQIQSTIAWDFLTDLDLSHNRLTSIDNFELPKTCPKLKHLDLSFNWLEKVTTLLHSRELFLRSIKLEGNPLCHDYIDPSHYVKVIRMMFPGLLEIDGVPIHLKGEFPELNRNFCPQQEAAELVNKFLEVFFPLLEMPYEERDRIEEMYHNKAVMTVTYRHSLRYTTTHKKYRNIFLRARVFQEGEFESIEGASAISRLVCKWPQLHHDPYTFTVDVLYHSEYSTILRIDGIVKITSETLAENEHLLAFTRTVVLTTEDGVEYKIQNEMVYWDEPSKELANVAFQRNTHRVSKRPSLKLECPPDEDLKGNLTKIFMKITDSDKTTSERCLELKDWNLKTALEYFIHLLKLDDLEALKKELNVKLN